MFLKKKNGRSQLSELDAVKVLEDFFIGENLLYAKILLIQWQEFGLSTKGSLRLVFMEML